MKFSLIVFLLAGLTAVNSQAGPADFKVLDKEGKPLADAVVVLYPGKPLAPGVPNAPVIIQQEKMRFVPAVTVVPLGTRVRFINMDTWDHHVRGTAEAVKSAMLPSSDEPNFGLRLAGKIEGKAPSSADVLMDKPGTVLLGCHLHGSMRGHVFVTDSAWTVKTDAEGNAHFDNVPAGSVQLRVWHAEDLLGHAAQTLQITDQAWRSTLQLNVVPRRRRI